MSPVVCPEQARLSKMFGKKLSDLWTDGRRLWPDELRRIKEVACHRHSYGGQEHLPLLEQLRKHIFGPMLFS